MCESADPSYPLHAPQQFHRHMACCLGHVGLKPTQVTHPKSSISAPGGTPKCSNEGIHHWASDVRMWKNICESASRFASKSKSALKARVPWRHLHFPLGLQVSDDEEVQQKGWGNVIQDKKGHRLFWSGSHNWSSRSWCPVCVCNTEKYVYERKRATGQRNGPGWNGDKWDEQMARCVQPWKVMGYTEPYIETTATCNCSVPSHALPCGELTSAIADCASANLNPRCSTFPKPHSFEAAFAACHGSV